LEPRTFVLVHSPIVGPDTWYPAADELRARGHHAVVPVIHDDGTPPFWKQHTAAVIEGVDRDVERGQQLNIVVHSGAGQLLAHIGEVLSERGHVVGGYVFVDAGVPTEGSSRLEQLRAEEPDFAEQLERLFEADSAFPDWSEELIGQLVPDGHRRQRLMAGIRRLPLGYWSEPIPPVSTWPDAPCGVLLLSGAYEPTADVAHARGWAVRRLETGNHFFMLVEPGTIADELLAWTRRWRNNADRRGPPL
jgi:hypothetical protein